MLAQQGFRLRGKGRVPKFGVSAGACRYDRHGKVFAGIAVYHIAVGLIFDEYRLL